MIGPVRPTQYRRWIAGAAAVLMLGSLVVGISLGDDGDDDAAMSGTGTPSSSVSPGTSEHPQTSNDSVTSGPGSGPSEPPPQGAVLPAGLTLSAGRAQHAAVPVAVADGQPLGTDRVAAIIDRLPDWASGDRLDRPFRWPATTTPKPKAGTTVDLPFPGPGSSADPGKPDASPAGALEVLRMQPQGAVSIAPFISITFNQPMVPVATVGQLSTVEVPVTISPKIAGGWQWIGTRTLRFAAEPADTDRLPMATEFVVTVPAGMRAANGATLGAAASFRFSTPPPTVKHFAPTGPAMSLDPVFVAVFDQKVDPQAVLRSVDLTVGGTSRPIRPATPDELAADPAAAKTVGSAPDGRVVAFRPARDLPTDQPVSVTFAKGTPSAEGPRSTTEPGTYTGHTYAALALTKSSCGWGDCRPGAPIVLTFNNPIDPAAFDPATVAVTPEIPGGTAVVANEKTITVQGSTQADTSYTVTVPAGLTDTFGQHLAAPARGTVRIGAARPRLDPFPQPVTTLDPMVDTPSVTVHSVNRTEFRERVFAVSTADWPAYQRFYASTREQGYRPNVTLDVPDWPVLVDRVVPIDGAANRPVSTTLDLSAAISGLGSTGTAVVLIEPTGSESFSRAEGWQNQPTLTWVQATTMSIDAFNDSTRLRAWVTDLRDGSPISGVTVAMLGSDGTVDPEHAAATDADGIAAMSLSAAGAGALLATKGEKTALLPSSMWNNSWTSTPTHDRLLWFVNDDRQTYRPGETASVKGWVRRQSADVAATLATVPPGSSVGYTVRDAYGTQIGEGSAKVSRLGGFDFTVDIPAGANLGDAWIELRLSGASSATDDAFTHSFRIADFRTPDFEVATHADSQRPAVVGDDLTVAADATYYAGGPLGDAQVDWQVRTAAASYAPPGWDGFTFGIWTPWWQTDAAGNWRGSRSDLPCCGTPDPDATDVEKFSGTTDADGSDYLQVRVGDLGESYAGLPVALTTQATVTDVNRQAIAGTTELLVHPADYYVGLSGDATFVAMGKDLVVRAIATDIDGAAAPDVVIDVRAGKVTTSWVNGESVDKVADVQTCRVTSGSRPVECTFTPGAAGTYRITATVTDKAGRISRTQLTRWVAGPDAAVDSSVQQQQLTLVPDKREYRPGQTARLLVQSPIRSGSALVTTVHNGITDTTRFAVADGSAVVTVPITDGDLPGITVSIEVVGTAPRSADADASGPPRPAYATGDIQLAVSTRSRELTVTAIPRQATVAPGGSTKLDVRIADQQGNPVAGSEFEVVVADEAVLAVGGYQLPDPMKAFYPELNNSISATYGRSTVMLADPPPPSGGGEATGAADGESAAGSAAAGTAAAGSGAASADQPGGGTLTMSEQRAAAPNKAAGDGDNAIAERNNFAPLALFVPSATTDADGRAVVDVPLPDNLTRYRVMVVAVAGDAQFGTAESTITAGLPLTVRQTGPAFLNFGDRLELPVLVQNRTDAALTTDVVIQTANLTVTGPAGQRVSVPANGRIEVRFEVAANKAGTAKFRVAAVSGDAADAATTEIPVYTPATTESFASYGTVAGGQTVTQPVAAPEGVVPQFGGMHISTSSTALQQLTDAVDYLADYDYTSSDALAAQVIAIGSLGDVLQAFSAPGLPSPEKLKSLVAEDVDKLVALQNDDGGFPYWARGRKSNPFNSIQATQALVVAAGYGAAVPSSSLDRAERYLAAIRRHIPSTASRATSDTLRAYALNVRMQAGHRDTAAATALVAARGSELPLDAVAWLLPVVDDPDSRAALLQMIDNAAVDDAGSVTFTNKVTDDGWTTLQSDVRTDALILDALIAVQPDSDLIGKVVSGLMGAQQGGRWNNVQENAFVLLALRHYYDAFESTAPDFVAGIWLGDRFAGEHAYRGHTTERATVSIPTAELLGAADSGDGTAVTVRNSGTGTLYYRLGLQTAPEDLKLAPLDRGFVVSRRYVGADNPDDVSRDADGTWHVKAGARVRVQLELVARSAHTHVALVDPLPAGLQILNPALATTPKDLDPQAAAGRSGGVTDTTAGRGIGSADAIPMSWQATWFDHQNLRDDRAEAFTSRLQGGVYSYSYLAAATTPGSFVAPPARAEQIYAPETFGRAGTDRVVVED